MNAVGYTLVAIAVAYFGAIVWLLAHARRRTPILMYTVWLIFFSALLALSAGTVYLRGARGLDYDWYYRACWIGWLTIAPLVQLAYHVRGKPVAARWAGIVLWTVWGGLLVLSLTTDLVEGGAESLYPFVDRLGRFERPARVLATATIAFALYNLYRAHQASRGVQRQQMAYMFLGMSIYAAIGGLTAGVLPLTHGVAFDPALTVLFSVTYTALTLYAVTQHRLFDVRLLLSRVVAGLLLVATATASTLVVYWLLAGAVGGEVAVVLAVFATASVFVATRLTAVVTAWLTRALGNKRRAPQPADGWALASVLDLSPLLERIVAIARESIDTASAGLMLRYPDGDYVLACGSGLPDAALQRRWHGRSAVLDWTRSDRAGVFVREEQLAELEAERRAAIDGELAPLAVEVIVPVMVKDDAIALILLGAKNDRDAFLDGDLELLRSLASHAALAIRNAQLYQRLNEVVVDLDGFVRAVAHDLRSPLHAIDQLAQFAVEDLADDPPAVAGHIRAMRQRGHRMEALLDSVNEYVRAGRGNEPLEVVDSAELVARIATRLRPRDGFTVACEGDMPVFETAAYCLEQILRHLIDNALRHHDKEEGTVTISARPHGSFIEFVVADDGPGIAPRFHAHVFGLFRTLKRRDLVEGSGMGLAVSKKLVQRAGGTIQITSDGRGTEVSFTWPRVWPTFLGDETTPRPDA
jgi:signal transduction histidine kinase